MQKKGFWGTSSTYEFTIIVNGVINKIRQYIRLNENLL